MAEFVQVNGYDPDFRNLPVPALLNVATIVRVVPKFAEGNGRCTIDHPGAKLTHYELLDCLGNKYKGTGRTLEKIGIQFEGIEKLMAG
jgi:hypothetical protein